MQDALQKYHVRPPCSNEAFAVCGFTFIPQTGSSAVCSWSITSSLSDGTEMPQVKLVAETQGEGHLQSWCISRINTLVTPFPITIQPGVPISDQIVYAAKRAIIGGLMRPGDAFPSVRTLSKDLRINPNTAHKAVTELINAGLLEMHPGIGTVVATPPDATPRERTRLLARQIEELVVEACRLGVDQEELLRSIAKQYQLLTPSARGQVRR
jgi:GntR family transcriptional regulator